MIGDYYLTDHAILRYLERKHKLFNLKEVRREIKSKLPEKLESHKTINGFVITKNAIVTYLGER